MDLADLSEMYRSRMEARGFAPKTLKSYGIAQRLFILYLTRTVGRAPTLDDLTLEHAIDWQIELQRRHLTQTSICSYTIILRAWGKWIAGYIPKLYPDGSPLAELVPPKPEKTVPDRLSVQEISALLGACPTMPYGKRDAAIILLMWDSGLRLGEVVALRRSDVVLAANGRNGNVHVRHGKGGKERSSGLGDRTSDALRVYLDTRQVRGMRPEHWLFWGRTGAHLGERGIGILLKQLAERAGVNRERVHAHAFRHTFGRAQVKLGTNTLALKEWMGHEKTDTTNHYARLEAAELEDAFVSVVDRALGPQAGVLKRGRGSR